MNPHIDSHTNPHTNTHMNPHTNPHTNHVVSNIDADNVLGRIDFILSLVVASRYILTSYMRVLCQGQAEAEDDIQRLIPT